MPDSITCCSNSATILLTKDTGPFIFSALSRPYSLARNFFLHSTRHIIRSVYIKVPRAVSFQTKHPIPFLLLLLLLSDKKAHPTKNLGPYLQILFCNPSKSNERKSFIVYCILEAAIVVRRACLKLNEEDNRPKRSYLDTSERATAVSHRKNFFC